MRASVRLFLLVNILATAALSGVSVFVVGLPFAASRALSPWALAAMAAAAAATTTLAGAGLLLRGVARPLDRLFAVAATLRQGGAEGDALPILGESRGFALSRASIAFERLARALLEERARLAAKVDELTRANCALADARESLVRSEKLATVGRLASGVAHEVGNPLGAIAGYVELARGRLPRDPHPELVDSLVRIGAAAERIDRTVRDLLDFARPAAPILAAVDVRRAVDAAVRLARVQARFRGVEVELDVPPGLPAVAADEHGLGQVLLNLFLNAGDAMSGAGTLRIGARAAAEEPSTVVVTVADSGPGIAPDHLLRIFDPFFTTKDPGKGTGLGLAISYRIMEAFGGEIAARNGEGGGAVFELRFRVAERVP